MGGAELIQLEKLSSAPPLQKLTENDITCINIFK